MTDSNENSNPEKEHIDSGNRQGNDSQSWQESSADELPGFRARPSDAAQDEMSFEEHSEAMIGRLIGPYRILQPLGHGGMGEVYLAEQGKPIRRRVALKLVKKDQGSKQILARFAAERQALAMMSHENIAKVLDAGEDNGQPYFAMELVKGIAITRYCDVNKLNVEERLALFVQICDAVNHAHQKGIIHRDLSPSNILVEEQNGTPVPKVIDFGLAKALNTQSKLADQTYFTEFGRVVGKVHYMSPEQAEMNPLDVDTRTDIYSLGVILFELLTGTRPLDDDTIKQNAFLKVLELIREQDAPKPSSRVSESSDDTIEAGKRRKTTQAKLRQELGGDLDWIVLKALEKNRAFRYSGANEFGADVRNYLNGDPVAARKPTFGYRLSKFVKKNRVPVFASCAVAAAIIAGLIANIVLTIHLSRALKSEQQARSQLEKSERNANQKANEATEAAELAKKNLAFARKGNEILGSVFAGLDPKAEYPEVSDLRNTLRNSLHNAVDELEGSSIGDPITVAAMEDTLGVSLLGLGEIQQAIVLFERALKTRKENIGPNAAETLTSMHNLAAGYEAAGQIDKALPLIQQTLELRKSLFGSTHPASIESLARLASCYLAAGQLNEALPLQEQVLKIRRNKLGPEHAETLKSMNSLAAGYFAAGKLDEGLPLLEKVVEMNRDQFGADHLETLNTMNNLSVGYFHTGKLDKALPLIKETYKLMKGKLGSDHPKTLASMNNLASFLRATGKLDLALPIYEETLKLRRAKQGAEHPDTLQSVSNLASAYQAIGKPELALPLKKEAFDRLKKMLGADHPQTLGSLNNLATGYQAVGKMNLALPLLEEALERTTRKLGPDHPETLRSMNNLATGYQAAGDLDRALPMLEETLVLIKAKLGDNHPDTLNSMNNLAGAYQALGKLTLATRLLQETITAKKIELGPDHPQTLVSTNMLANCYRQSGQFDKALPLFLETFNIRKDKFGPNHPDTLQSMGNLGRAYCDVKQGGMGAEVLTAYVTAMRKRFSKDQQPLADFLVKVSLELLGCDQFTSAEHLLRESLAISEKESPNSWKALNTLSLLGESLLGQNNYSEAEPFLLKSYKKMKQREDIMTAAQNSKYFRETLDRLIELYAALDQPKEREKYRKLREAHRTSGPSK